MVEVKRRKAILFIPSTSQVRDLQLYAHSVNVTFIALQMAKQLKFTELELRDLALGCLLHDIGKVVTDRVDEHPKSGYEVLRKERELSLLSAHVALQHHEKLDGTGFPRQLIGSAFLLICQLSGLANLYENAISLDGVSPHEVVEVLMAIYGIQYSEEVVAAFINGVPGYPPGTKV